MEQRAESQKRFEFDYAAWCRAVERHRLPYQAQELLKILKSFDQGKGSWPSLNTITERCNRKGLWSSRNTTKTWLRKLKLLGFITITPRFRGDGDHACRLTDLIVINDHKVFDDVSACGGGGGSISDGGGSISDPPVDQKLTPNHLPSLNLLKNKSHGHGGDGVLKCSKTGKSVNWRRAITAAELNDPETVEELFGVAVGQLPDLWRDLELDRITFFGLAIIAREKENPGGWFTCAISGKWSSFVTAAAEDRARRAVKSVIYG